MNEKFTESNPINKKIRAAVDEYIDGEVETGQLTKTDIKIDPTTMQVTGWVHLETLSGVQISKSTQGYLELCTEYEDSINGEPVDVSQTFRLFPGVDTEITEQIQGSHDRRTLPRRDHERLAIEMVSLIKTVY
jgi:hypothetical protein